MLVPTLTITDRQDGTGATATLAGGDPAAVNTISIQRPFQVIHEEAWQSVGGSLTGNGTLNLSLPTGYYWAVCTSVLGGQQTVSNIVWCWVTAASESVQYRILQAVQGVIQTLALPKLPPEQVYQTMLPDPNAAEFPAVFVTPEDKELYQGGMNESDDVARPAVIWIADRNDQDYFANESLYLLWRERIQRRFSQQRLPGVPEVFRCVVEPREIIKYLPPAFAYFTSPFLLRFTSRDRRVI